MFSCLKGLCHEIFCFWFFPWLIFPQASDNSIRIISNIVKHLLRYLLGDIGGKFATKTTSVVDTGGKKWEHYQTADNLKSTWRTKIYLYIYSTNQSFKAVWKKYKTLKRS